jgi:hypothetical protein
MGGLLTGTIVARSFPSVLYEWFAATGISGRVGWADCSKRAIARNFEKSQPGIARRLGVRTLSRQVREAIGCSNPGRFERAVSSGGIQ